jgi:hypothetical protein
MCDSRALEIQNRKSGPLYQRKAEMANGLKQPNICGSLREPVDGIPGHIRGILGQESGYGAGKSWQAW